MSSGRITLDEVLAACEKAGMVSEPVTASEVAEELGCTRRAALNKLDELAERGDVESKKVGARSRVWWRPPDLESSADPRPIRDGDETDDASEVTPVRVEGTLSDVSKRLDAELEEVFGRISDAFYALDAQWRFTYVSERAEELLDYRDEGLVGKDFWEVFEWADDSKLGAEYRKAMEAQEPTSFEFYYPDPLEAWYEIHAYPSETGLSVYFRDVTERKQRERRLEESEHRYRTLVENFPNGAVALVDEDLTYRTVGGDPLDVADVTVDEVESSPVDEILPPELADELVPRYEAALDGESDSFEAEYDGSIFEFQVVPVRDDDGDVFAALGMSWDVTERTESQRELEESERRYRTLIENFPSGAVGLFDEELRYTAVGGQLLDALDFSPEERIGRRISDIHSDDLLAEIEPYFRAALEGDANSFEIEYQDRHLSAHTVPVRNADGEVYAGMLVVQDVTERREAQRELRESEAKFRMLAENLDEIVWMATADAEEFVYINPAFEAVWGLDRDELYDDPLSFLDAVHPDDRDRVRDAFTALPESELDEEFRIVRSDGEVRWVHARGTRVHDEDGEMIHIVGIGEDITERVERERELEESERRYRTLAENFPNGAVGVYDHDLRYTLAAGEKIGDPLPSAAELEGTKMTEQYPDHVAADLEPIFRAAIEDGETGSAQTTVAGRNWQAWATPLRDADGEIFAGLSFTQDITEQVEREAELERALDLLDRTQRIADVGGWEIDVETQDVFWTDHVFELLEVPGDEEPSLDEALDMYHEEDKPIVTEAVENALDSGEPFDVEVRLRTAASDEVRWLRLQGVPETDDGEVVSLRGAAQDVTEKVERERELEERNQRLDSFASMLAHELRNPVTIGQIYGQQLSTEVDSEAAEYVTEAFERIEDMIDVLLVLTRGREAVGERTPVQLADAAREAWDKAEAPEATLEVELDRTIPADETYVQHLFRNLFENAVEHGSTSPRSQAHENAVEHGGADVTITVGDLPSGFYVADDGVGIPEDERDSVFDEGYTTAADSGGTGLGLAFVQRLADVYGWEYAVTESESGGARFEFTNVESDA